jgi:phenylalanyl-tRNA synthetase beta chain
MKTSLQWLSQYLPGPLEARELAERLTLAGLPVEHILEHGDDRVLDVEVTSNRSDCLCHLGVARELAALLRRQATGPAVTAQEAPESAAAATQVAIEAPDLCPHYTARIIRGVRVGPSPAWMVRRLEAIGQRSINNIVDVTNYVMFEMGQPLHAFDHDKLAEGRIVVRRARAGEQIVTLDGRPRSLSERMLVIADARVPVALAGVMGGRDSEVSEGTTNILLESARFDPLSVRQTARALALASESSYRFERQIDPTLPVRASLRAAQLILETAGGRLLAGCVEAGSSGHAPRTLSLRPARLAQVLGIAVSTADIVDVLRRLEMDPVVEGPAVHVTVPSWRLDLRLEVDLIEEVARVLGYDRIPVREEIQIRLQPPEPQKAALEEVRAALVAAGYFEALTVSFVADAVATEFLPEGATLLRADPAVRRGDGRLRPSILPGLLQAVRHNQTVGIPDAQLFEIGPVFWLAGPAECSPGGKVTERRCLGMVGGTDHRLVRGAVETVLARLDPDRPLEVVPGRRPGLAPEAAAVLRWGDTPVGYIGRIAEPVVRALDLRQAVFAAELELDPLLELARPVRQLHELPRYPAVDRDVSLVVAETVSYDQIGRTVRELALPDLEAVRHVTTYRGKPLAAGTKSVSLHLVFRSPTTTLTSEQVEGSVQRAIAAAREKLGATLRT